MSQVLFYIVSWDSQVLVYIYVALSGSYIVISHRFLHKSSRCSWTIKMFLFIYNNNTAALCKKYQNRLFNDKRS